MIHSILEKAYPGLRLPAPDEILSTDDAVGIARTYIEEHYPDCRCVILFGSHSRGEQKLASDLDLLIILPKFAPGRGTEMLRTIHQGVRIEVFLFTEATYLDALSKQKMTAVKVFSYAVTEGMLVAGSADLAQRLRSAAQCHLQDGGSTLEPKVFEPIRVQITSQLLKLSSAAEHFERVHYATIVFNSLSLAVLRLEAGEHWAFERLPKRFRKHDPAAAEELESAYLKICLNGNPDDFIKSAGTLLDRLGGPAWLGVTEPLGQKSVFQQLISFIAMATMQKLRAGPLALMRPRRGPVNP